MPFVFLENSHLQAIARTSAGVESTVTLTNHTGAGDVNGGTVQTAVAVPATSTLTIYREVPITQTTIYQEGGDFPAASHERALDKLTQVAQQNQRQIGASIRFSEATQLNPVNPPVSANPHVLTTVNGGAPTWETVPSVSTALNIPALTDTSTVGPSDELIVQQSGLPRRATANELLNGSATVTATGSTTGRTLKNRFADVVNAKDFGAIGDGVTNDSPAIQAAVDYCSANQKTLFVPNGVYRLASRIEITSTTAGSVYVNIVGEDVTNTRFTVNGSENSNGAFYFYKNGPLLDVTIQNIFIIAQTATGNCGTAIHAEEIQGGTSILRSVYLNNICVNTEDVLVPQTVTGVMTPVSPAFWTNGIVVKHSNRPILNMVTVDNPKCASNDDAIRYKDNSASYLGSVGIDVSDCYGPSLDLCVARQFSVGFRAYTNASSTEGGDFRRITAVNVKTGVLIDADGSAGVEPGLNISGNHINFRDYGVYINKRKGIVVEGILFYHQNTQQGAAGYGIANPVDVYIPNGNDALIQSNRFTYNAGVDRIGAYVANFTAGTGVEPNLRVSDNIFDAQFNPAVLIATYPSFEQFVEPEVGSNWFGFAVKQQIRIGFGTFKVAPYQQHLMSDVFTPDIGAAMSNIDSISPQTGYFLRVGNIVNLWGRVSINPTATGIFCEFEMSAPIAVTLPITELQSGTSYTVKFVGTSNFTSVGASANTVGTVFTATGSGVGTGLVTRNTLLLSDHKASGVITSINSAVPSQGTGIVYGSSGKLAFRVLPTGTANGFYYYNASYLIE